MTKERTYAADIDRSRNAAEMAKLRSKDSERAKVKDPNDRAERDDADALAAAASQSGQT